MLPSVRERLFSPRPQAGEGPHSSSPLPSAGEGPGERGQSYSNLKIDPGQINAAIFGHAEFTAFNQQVSALFDQWKTTSAPLLAGIKVGNRPKALVETISESLLETFRPAPLIDPYDVYQHLMDYWAETMQDDVYMIAGDGWNAAKVVRQIIPTQDKNGKAVYREPHDFVFDKKRYKADIIPPALMVARYFPTDLAAIEQIELTVAALEQQMEEMREENGGEEGLLFDVIEDGKISMTSVADRLKAIKGDKGAEDERKASWKPTRP